ncbi:peptidoglycan/xylan/chitin deacetylase (PgdA/CDA1 family) [Pseudarthrobacter siccitolerans]|uniref:Peptidoglycan/xylan/chitin deacetylase (PgdA/CDA1 family) n=2 Tax=Pseudarthrobacter siccitolerans TaxID=861266 RepID=A0ABU0PN52_9MICC|nr:peptidoglycan/xylan/chitin deacetylase (PgdA/CDA1 family) [Pseudarthrobacter siccitolerans]
MTVRHRQAQSTKGFSRRYLLGAGICLMSYPLLETLSQNRKLEQTEPWEDDNERQREFPDEDDVSIPPQLPRTLSVPSRGEVIRSFTGQVPVYWGLEAPGVLKRLPASSGGVVLTVDFCGGPGGNAVDTLLLNALRQNGIPATLFLNSRWIRENPLKSQELANDPLFELANHGSAHSPLSVNGKSAYGIPGTKGPEEIYDEIMTSNAVLEDLTGRPQRFFRPGTAYMDDVAVQIVHALGLIPTGFSINGDGGATFTASIVAREVSSAAQGDIVIVHGNHPEGGTAQGLIQALASTRDLNGKFMHFPATVA